jgi:hypothetical protein
MGQPPAEVVQTFTPVGDLQFYRLRQSAPFHCVRCQKDKTDSLVATIDGDWAQMVCERCYFRLTWEQRKEARKAARRMWRAGRATQQPSREVRPEQLDRRNGSSAELTDGQLRAVAEALEVPSARKVKTPAPRYSSPAEQAIAKGRRQQFTQRPVGIDSLLEFFHAAGVDAQLEPTGHLWIDGHRIEPLTQVPSPGTAEWSNVINEIALKYVRDKFIRAVEDNARFVAGLGASLLPLPKGVAIMRGDERLGVIRPAHASIPHYRFIYENFLTAGPHWQQVANGLHDAEAKRAAGSKHEQEAAKRRRIDQLPDDLAPELIDACLDASRRIRLERRLDYGDTPVILECDVGELTLLPIAGPESRLLVPFRLSKGTETLAGQLILDNGDPLPVLIGEDVADEDAITAWTCALLGFADATCVELDPAEPTARRESARPRRRPRSPASHPRRPAQTLPSKHRWPSYLEPVGSHTIDYIDSIVRGHRRHLPGRQTASDEACDRARRIGIILRSNETWVQPHSRGRGLPPGVELRFLWHAAAELKLFR